MLTVVFNINLFTINIISVPFNNLGLVSWLDKNNDGKREVNQFLPGFVLSIQYSNANLIQTITDSDGNYYFGHLLLEVESLLYHSLQQLQSDQIREHIVAIRNSVYSF
ncbi:hypothetical protein ACTFIY_007527 [Dictyostelium cf. discoideum]